MTTFPFTTTGDFLAARVRREAEIAAEILERARAANEYFEEKNAAKILAYYELERDLMLHYIELKLYYPETAAALEAHKPHLARIWSDAENELALLMQQNPIPEN